MALWNIQSVKDKLNKKIVREMLQVYNVVFSSDIKTAAKNSCAGRGPFRRSIQNPLRTTTQSSWKSDRGFNWSEWLSLHSSFGWPDWRSWNCWSCRDCKEGKRFIGVTPAIFECLPTIWIVFVSQTLNMFFFNENFWFPIEMVLQQTNCAVQKRTEYCWHNGESVH